MSFLEKLGGGIIKLITREDAPEQAPPTPKLSPAQEARKAYERLFALQCQPQMAPGDDAIVRELERQLTEAKAKCSSEELAQLAARETRDREDMDRRASAAVQARKEELARKGQ